MANDTGNRPNGRHQGQNSEDKASTLTSDHYLQSGLIDTRDRQLDPASDYHLAQGNDDSNEYIASNLHLGGVDGEPYHVPPLPAPAGRDVPEADLLAFDPDDLAPGAENGLSADLVFDEPSANGQTIRSEAPLDTEDLENLAPAAAVGMVDAPGSSAPPVSLAEEAAGTSGAMIDSGAAPAPSERMDPLQSSADGTGLQIDLENDGGDGAESESSREETVTPSQLSAVADADGSDNTVTETAAPGTATGITAQADAGGSTQVTYSLQEDAAGLFSIDPVTGVVSVAGQLDAETAASHTITVIAQSSDGQTQTESFTISVGDVNEARISDLTDTTLSANEISENAPAGSTVGVTAHAEDSDATDTVSYEINDARFTIDANGHVTVADGAVFDAETESQVTFTVMATSSDGSSSSEDFTLNVSDYNEYAASDVVDTGDAANAVSEDAQAGDEVGLTVHSDDPDATDTVSYTLDDPRFAVDEEGVVTVAEGAVFDADTESSIDVKVTATSSDGSQSEETFTIDVSGPANAAPTNIQLVTDTSDLVRNGSFEEFDVGSGSLIQTETDPSGAWATDSSIEVWDRKNGIEATEGDQHIELDSGNEVDSISQSMETVTGQVYTLSMDAQSRMGSSMSTVEVYWNGELVDTFDPAKGSWSTYEFQVVGTGGSDLLELKESAGDNVSICAFIDNVTLKAHDMTVAEGVDGAVVGTLTTTDPDQDDTHSYTVSDDRFEVVEDTSGQQILKLKDAADLDREAEETVTVTITSTDEGGLSVSEDFTITVADINEFAVSALTDSDPSANTISETAAAGADTGITAAASDADATDTVSFSIDDDRFDVGSDGKITVADGASFDAETESTIDVTVTVVSSDGSSSQETFTISVSDVNESAVSDVTDTDSAANTISEDASGGADTGVTVSVSDDVSDTVTYSIDDSRFAVAEDGTVTVADGATFDHESEPVVSFTVTATSSDGSQSTQSFDIAVSDVAETYQIAAGKDQFTDDGVSETTITGTDGAETITAHEDGSTIYSGAGDDVIHGGDGNDHIEFGTGADTVYGGAGNDFIDDAMGVQISDADNYLDGGAGNDRIYSGDGNDTLIGGDGKDVLTGEGDDDLLSGDGGDDLLRGGTGTDTAVYSGNLSDYTITDDNGVFTVTDNRDGSPDGTDTVMGVENFRFADGTYSADELQNSAPTALKVSGTSALGLDSTGLASGTVVAGIETVADADAGDSFHFSFVQQDNDLLEIDPVTGELSLRQDFDGGTALTENVTVKVTDSGNAAYEETISVALGTNDNDALNGSAQDDIVYAFGGNDTVDGGGGTDCVVLTGAQNDYSVHENTDGSLTLVDTREGSPDGTVMASNVETFVFSDGDVAAGDLAITPGAPLLDADSSGNSFHELAEAGTKVGVCVASLTSDDGASSYAVSDDRFSVDADGNVVVADHAFFDSQSESSIDVTVTASAADGSVSTGSFSLRVTGDYDCDYAENDMGGSFYGSGQSFHVDGAGGSDTLQTGDENDRIEGGSGGAADQIIGNGGRDLLMGEGGADCISGNAGNDILVGGAGDDSLHGGDGSDLFMYGLGDGNDTVYGGAGSCWTDVIDLGGDACVSSAGDYCTDWTVTVTTGTVENVITEEGRLELSQDASGTIDFADGSKIDFAQVEEIRW